MKLRRIFKSLKSGLLLLLVAIPWFCRDYFATNLDRQNDLVQKALVQANNQDQAEAQNQDQREVLWRLKNLEEVAAPGKKDDIQALQEYAVEVRRDGDDLQRQAKELEDLAGEIRKAGLESEMGKTLADADKAIQQAKDAGQLQVDWGSKMVAFLKDSSEQAAASAAATSAGGSQPPQQDGGQQSTESATQAEPPTEVQLKAANTAAEAADDKLTEAYVNVKRAAEKVRDDTASDASFARTVAWIGTALAALLAGDWKKLLQTLTGGSGDSETAEETVEQTA
jgi:hypothetical protein